MDSDDEDFTVVVTTGGVDALPVEYVLCDNSNYFICSRVQDTAYIKSHKAIFKKDELLKELYERFPYLTPGSTSIDDKLIYIWIINESSMFDILEQVTIDLMTKLKSVDKLAIEKLNKYIKQMYHGKDLAVKFPTMVKRPILKKEMKYNPVELEVFINSLIQHIKEYNLNAVSGQRFHFECLRSVNKFSKGLFEHKTIQLPEITNEDSIIEIMTILSQHENEMSDYLTEYEKYNREVIIVLNTINRLITKIKQKLNKS